MDSGASETRISPVDLLLPLSTIYAHAFQEMNQINDLLEKNPELKNKLWGKLQLLQDFITKMRDFNTPLYGMGNICDKIDINTLFVLERTFMNLHGKERELQGQLSRSVNSHPSPEKEFGKSDLLASVAGEWEKIFNALDQLFESEKISLYDKMNAIKGQFLKYESELGMVTFWPIPRGEKILSHIVLFQEMWKKINHESLKMFITSETKSEEALWQTDNAPHVEDNSADESTLHEKLRRENLIASLFNINDTLWNLKKVISTESEQKSLDSFSCQVMDLAMSLHPSKNKSFDSKNINIIDIDINKILDLKSKLSFLMHTKKIKYEIQDKFKKECGEIFNIIAQDLQSKKEEFCASLHSANSLLEQTMRRSKTDARTSLECIPTFRMVCEVIEPKLLDTLLNPLADNNFKTLEDNVGSFGGFHAGRLNQSSSEVVMRY